jgi:transmembrane sensor
MIMESPNRIAILLFLNTRNELSADEEKELSAWRSLSPVNEKLYQETIDPEKVREKMKDFFASRDRIFEKIRQQYPSLKNAELLETDDVTGEVEDVESFEREEDMPSLDDEILSTGLTKFAYWESILQKRGFAEEGFPDMQDELNDAAIEPATTEKQKKKKKKSPVYWLGRIAALFLLVLGVYIYFISGRKGIKPGSMKAQIFSGNGFSGLVNDFNFGYQVGRMGFKVGKDKNGKTLFVAPNDTSGSADKFNTLKTPRGGEITIQFPDGTVMWIDAESRLDFPLHFAKDTTSIRFEGQAYLEIPRNQNKVFQLLNNGTITTVNGDGAFINIRSYPDERISKTTLLQGLASYGVSGKTSPVLLQPGTQVQMTGDSLKTTTTVNVNEIVAWTNNRTVFHNESVQTIMRFISRWYDVDVVYEEPISAKLFNLDLPRDADITLVLAALRMQGVHTVVNDKTITVLRSDWPDVK